MGEEVMMNESIIVGLVIGGGVAVIGALIGHFLRLREIDQQWDREKQRMEALWAEEERRRKSDRRRELYERELRIVSDSVDAIMELMAATKRLTWREERERVKWRFDLAEAFGLILKSHLVAIS
ncbi:MAG: hypothetical protein MUP04_09110, partial [Anaerolineae bacterium]|nr:hypothetical protein [Anaerolineae bacterium]